MREINRCSSDIRWLLVFIMRHRMARSGNVGGSLLLLVNAAETTLKRIGAMLRMIPSRCSHVKVSKAVFRFMVKMLSFLHKPFISLRTEIIICFRIPCLNKEFVIEWRAKDDPLLLARLFPILRRFGVSTYDLVAILTYIYRSDHMYNPKVQCESERCMHKNHINKYIIILVPCILYNNNKV